MKNYSVNNYSVFINTKKNEVALGVAKLGIVDGIINLNYDKSFRPISSTPSSSKDTISPSSSQTIATTHN